jgi:hypothetical protein
MLPKGEGADNSPKRKSLILLVPAEGIEPPTFGLQNRCSTAELSRLLNGGWRANAGWHFAPRSAGRISDLRAKGQNLASV